MKTIQSTDKEKFDELVYNHLEEGWEIVENGYNESGNSYIQKMIKNDKSKDYVVSNKDSPSYYPDYYEQIHRDGKKHGLFFDIRKKDGLELQRGFFQHNKKYGKWKWLDEEYDKIYYTNYRDDLRDGKYTLINNGKIEEEGFYRKDKRIGFWIKGNKVTLYDDSGYNGKYKIYNSQYHIEEYRLQGENDDQYSFSRLVEKFNDDDVLSGVIVEGGTYRTQYGWMIDGECVEYQIKGDWKNHKKYVCNYSQGRLNGEFREYYNDNSYKCIKNYKFGFLNGVIKEFYKNKNLKFEGEFQYRTKQIFDQRLSDQEIDDLDSRERYDYLENFDDSPYEEELCYKVGKWIWYNEEGEIIKQKKFDKSELYDDDDDDDYRENRVFFPSDFDELDD